MTPSNRTKSNPDIVGLALLLAATIIACGENTQLIGTGEPLTSTPCDTCAEGARPSCDGKDVTSCRKRTDGTCGWARCAAAPEIDAGTAPPPPPPDAGGSCPAQVCAAINCQYGNKKDEKGCSTCECNAAPTCPSMVCPTIYCPYGNTKDDKGCTTCACNPPPVACNLLCVKGKHCELQKVECVRAPCDPVPTCVDDPMPTPDPCTTTSCPAGTICKSHPVTCVRAPCPPVAECIPQVHCGGFAGKPCPGSGSCHDDPTDSCDPANGGADCGGLCVCKQPAACPPDRVWDDSPAVCDCVKVPAGEACGSKTCGDGEFCCNKSCSVCAPTGGACDSKACVAP
jgi:hypothetical protein